MCAPGVQGGNGSSGGIGEGQGDDAVGHGLGSRTTRSASCSLTIVFMVVICHHPVIVGAHTCLQIVWIRTISER